MKWIFTLLLLVVPCYSRDPEMPACNAKNQGRLWPEQANSDPAVAKQAGRCGELQMCTLGVWKYNWRPLTVHVGQLGKTRNRVVPGCRAIISETSKREAGLKESRP